MDPKLKIYFYSPCVTTFYRPVEAHAKMGSGVFVNPTPLYLDSYIRRNEPDLLDKFEWAHLQYLPLTREEFIKDIENYQVDVVALSIYTWNKAEVLSLIKDIHKDLSRSVKIIIGGPSVDVVRNDQWLLDLPEIDFAIYAQGEVPFVSVLKHYLGIEKISVLKTKNVAWVENGKVRKADYEFTKIKNGSPIVDSAELLERVARDPQLQGKLLQFPYETSRGCPYKCSFCDWTSGLSHKMSKRKFHFEDELEKLGELGIVDLYLADSNFGMFPEDIEIAKTLARLKREKNYNFYIHGNNFSKTKKDIVFEIADIFAAAGLTHYLKFSIQDIDENVLKNIDRPDISWEKHINYILKLKEAHPNMIVAADIISGLPGQTRKTWARLYSELCYHNIHLHIYDWEMIPNSPAAYDKEYQERMKLKTITTKRGSVSRDLVVETISYSMQDYAYFKVLQQIYDGYFRNHAPAFPKFIKLIDNVKNLDHYLNDICANLKNDEFFFGAVKDIMKQIIQHNYKDLNPTFIKHVVLNNGKPITGNLMEDTVSLIKPTQKTQEEIELEVFRELQEEMVC